MVPLQYILGTVIVSFKFMKTNMASNKCNALLPHRLSRPSFSTDRLKPICLKVTKGTNYANLSETQIGAFLTSKEYSSSHVTS